MKNRKDFRIVEHKGKQGVVGLVSPVVEIAIWTDSEFDAQTIRDMLNACPSVEIRAIDYKPREWSGR